MSGDKSLYITNFKSERFGNIRTLDINGNPWFIGKDVAEALGYVNPTKAVTTHCDLEDRVLIQSSQVRNFEIPNRGMVAINESGLYALILSSKLAEAKAFKKWVTNVVIPTIRKTGAFIQSGREEEAVENYLPNLPSDVKDSVIRSIRVQNKKLMMECNELRENLLDISNANKAMAKGILEWENRASVVRAVRKLGGKRGCYAGSIWDELYTQLYYKHGISLKARGEAPYIQHVRDDEWHSVVDTLCAMCEAYGTNAGEIFKKLKVA